ncbi:MAG TPA: Re/Si-specific NAD(P)(+) transhydrogenase subunit alpha [Tepidisphaeraceae bacterium]|nr:Re/Si-specific NAD(P)(+) transhydrogenase subunit alpha [Tepidisphaeraceae bacterium]
MIIAVPTEIGAGETRVALTPSAVALLVKDGHEVRVQRGAGFASGFTDSQYIDKKATIVDDRGALIHEAEVILQVRVDGQQDSQHFKAGQIVIGFADPLSSAVANLALAEKGVTLLSMELIPRITRAQAIDALSSQANLAGYKAVIRAADILGKILPMMITAAGTIQPARVFVVGAGVAGLQAIATAKRLGAVVSAIDVRPEVAQQVESLGGKFVMPPVQASGEGGYAKELTEEQKALQQKMMADTVADSDVVVTTALIPGRPAPKLVSAEMVERMRPGSVVVDMAAERGGNCALTEPGKIIVHNGVTIVGETNLTSQSAHDASSMYAGNLVKLIQHLTGKTRQITWNMADEITAGVVVCKDGQVVHPQVKKAMGIAQ